MNQLDLKMLWLSFAVALCAGGCLSKIGDSSIDARYQRDAQSLASVCASAQAAGWDFVAEGKGDLDETVRLVRRGHAISDTSSPFDGVFFGASGIRSEDLEGISRHLEIQNGMLMYLAARKPIPHEDAKIAPQVVGVVVASSIALLTILIVLICKKVGRKSI